MQIRTVIIHSTVVFHLCSALVWAKCCVAGKVMLNVAPSHGSNVTRETDTNSARLCSFLFPGAC